MNIAVFPPNWIGDAVMATPALRALRRHYSNTRIIGVLRPYVAEVFAETPWFDHQIPFVNRGPWSEKWFSTAWRLRRFKPDLAVLFPNSFRSALTAWLAGCRRRIGYNRYGRGCLLTDCLEPIRDDKGRLLPSPIIDAYNSIAERAGCEKPGYKMELFTSGRDEDLANIVWEEEKLCTSPEVICLNPGAAFGAAKHWPTDYFARLAQMLIDERGSAILVLCGPKEASMAQRIAALANRTEVYTLASYTPSIGMTKACIRRADLLITTDSGPRHFAAAFDKPVVSLFGPTHIPWTITYHPKEVCLQKSVPCGPCQLRKCPLDHRCMRELTPEEVFAAATQLLFRFPSSPTASQSHINSTSRAGREEAS